MAAATASQWQAKPIQARIPRDSTEFLPLDVTYQGAPVRTGLLVSVTFGDSSNRSWRPADVDERGRTGVRVNGLQPGHHRVFVRSATGAVMPAGMILAL